MKNQNLIVKATVQNIEKVVGTGKEAAKILEDEKYKEKQLSPQEIKMLNQ